MEWMNGVSLLANQRPTIKPHQTDPECDWLGAAYPSPTQGNFYCNNPTKPLGKVVRKCQGCDATCKGYESELYPANLYITTERLVADASKFASKLISKLPNLEYIVAIPRSGLLPATVIATHLHLPLYVLLPSGHINLVPGGWRMTDSRQVYIPSPTVQGVLIDDTVSTGAAMQRANAALQSYKLDTAAMYVSDEGVVDHYHAVYPGPHYLEWNWQNAVHGEQCAYDMDGILCEDVVPHAHDDDPVYVKWLEVARPLYLPRRREVPLIVTGRHERYRDVTLAWLARYGVRVSKLVMRQDDKWDMMQSAMMKAAEYQQSALRLFAESDKQQAEIIARVSGMPVLCPSAKRVYT